MGSPENSMAWLEAALTENLRPVGAPAELWDRVEMPRVVAGRRLGWPAIWQVALTSAVAAILAVGLWSFGRPGQELHSSDPAAIRAWVQDRCGFALPLSAAASPEIRLSDVRLQHGGAATELAFSVENRPAILEISRATGAATGETHHQLAAEAKSVSWVTDGKLFTLACATPEDLRVACSLCHAGGVL